MHLWRGWRGRCHCWAGEGQAIEPHWPPSPSPHPHHRRQHATTAKGKATGCWQGGCCCLRGCCCCCCCTGIPPPACHCCQERALLPLQRHDLGENGSMRCRGCGHCHHEGLYLSLYGHELRCGCRVGCASAKRRLGRELLLLLLRGWCLLHSHGHGRCSCCAKGKARGCGRGSGLWWRRATPSAACQAHASKHVTQPTCLGCSAGLQGRSSSSSSSRSGSSSSRHATHVQP